jgi:hypothetical protein
MDLGKSLRDATVQEIQLELIRRTSFNDFNGERVCELLERHRERWRAVLLDRPGVPNYAEPARLLIGGLIKLRDLEDNIWNADTLFVLTHTIKDAHELAVAFDQANMAAMPHVFEDMSAMDRALGTGRETYGILTLWWD